MLRARIRENDSFFLIPFSEVSNSLEPFADWIFGRNLLQKNDTMPSLLSCLFYCTVFDPIAWRKCTIAVRTERQLAESVSGSLSSWNVGSSFAASRVHPTKRDLNCQMLGVPSKKR